MSRRPVFKLVSNTASSQDTVECLRAMLRDAEAGEMIGIAAGAMYRSRKYVFHACGEAYRSPTWAAGMLTACVSMLVDRVKRH